MLQEKLKQQTQKFHDRLESLMHVNAVMDKTLTFEQYKKNIFINFLAHDKLENFLFGALSQGLKEELHVNQRRKLAALKQDIISLHLEEVEFNYDVELPHPVNDAYVLGALYVLEGATLGGQVIAKQVQSSRLNDLVPFNYYHVYGSNVGAYWKSFVNVLNNLPEDDHKYATAGAMMVFHMMISLAEKVNGTKL